VLVGLLGVNAILFMSLLPADGVVILEFWIGVGALIVGAPPGGSFQ
jgi:hypothetical protein